MLCTIVAIGVMYFVTSYDMYERFLLDPIGVSRLLVAMQVLGLIGYYFCCYRGLKQHGQTLAKKWLKLRVRKSDGGVASPFRIYVSRFWNRLLEIIVFAVSADSAMGGNEILFGVTCSIWMLIVGIDVIMLFANRGKSLHDVVAKTRVEGA